MAIYWGRLKARNYTKLYSKLNKIEGPSQMGNFGPAEIAEIAEIVERTRIERIARILSPLKGIRTN